jgi:Mrp family chromosome partitioning ATPase
MIEPINIFGALRQRWRLIVVLAVLGAVVALLLPTSTPKHPKTLLKYETLATVGAPASSGLISGTVSNQQIIFYANTFPVKLAAVSDVGLKGDPYLYAVGMFGTTATPTTKGGAYPTGAGTTASSGKKNSASGGNVTLYASAPTQQLAADLANDYAKELGNTLESIAATHAADVASSSKGSASTSADGSPFAATSTGYQVIFPGTPELAHRINVAKVSTFASHKVRLVVGLLGGTLLALLIILAREVLNKTIRRTGRAEHHFKFPVIADIPETYPPDPGVVDIVDRPTSPSSEAYRKLRMSVLFESMASDAAPTGAASDAFADMFGMGAAQGEPYKVPEPGSRNVLLVTSTVDEPSRSKVVANLAASYAEAGEYVIVVSTADLEVGTTFPADSFQTGPITPEDIERWITPAGPENVSMLSMRHFMRNSGQLVSRSKEVLDAAREIAAVVIVETPAFLRYHHGEALVHSVDAVIIVVENAVTEVPDAQDMGDILRRLGAPVLGVVFTGEELSKGQKRVLDAGMAASGRTGAFHPPDTDGEADVTDDASGTASEADDSGNDRDVPAAELHPT